jgi:hypothetical protein
MADQIHTIYLQQKFSFLFHFFQAILFSKEKPFSEEIQLKVDLMYGPPPSQ